MSNNSVIALAAAPAQQTSEVKWTPGEIAILKEAVLDAQASNAELALFSKICEATGLNPFAKQIYGIRRKGKVTFQCSIDGYRLIADRTGQYAGNDDPLYDEGLSLYQHLVSGRGNPLVASVTVWKVVGGVRCNFTASASWEQYAQTFWDKQQSCHKLSETWQKMPHLMLSKCAESLALRKAFPNELSSLRTSDEMQAVEQDTPPVSTPTVFNPSLAASQRPHPRLQPPQQDATVRSAVEAAAPIPKPLPTTNPAASSAVAGTLHRLKWSEFQIQNCLIANFDKVHLTELDDEQLLDFLDYLAVFEQTSAEVKRLKWAPEQGKKILKLQFGIETRSNLTYQQLAEFLQFLKSQQPTT